MFNNPYYSLDQPYYLPIPQNNCYNPHIRTNYRYVQNSLSPEMKTSVEELRNYIINLEANRRLEDLNNVDFPRPVKPGDLLYYEGENWEITDYLSGGTW